MQNRNLFSLHTAVCAMLLFAVTTVSYAAVDFTVDNLGYKITSTAPATVQVGDGEVSLDAAGEVIIPASVVNPGDSVTYAVTAIGANAFDSSMSMLSVVIAPTIKTIGANAFNNCYYAEGALDMSSCAELTDIGDYAFSSTGFTSVVFPASLLTIGEGAFSNSTLGDTIDLSVCTSLPSIGDYAFENCSTSLDTLLLPASLITIGESAFGYNYSLAGTLDLSACPLLITIADYAFAYCESFSAVVFPASLENLGTDAFAECFSLSGALDLSVCTNLKVIGNNAFGDCEALESLALPLGLTTIEYNAFSGCTAMGGALDLSGLTALSEIGNNAFRSCANFTSVKFPASLTTVGYFAFGDCTAMTGVDLAACVAMEEIPEGLFYQCTGLTGIDMSGCAALTTIKEVAFIGCTDMVSLTLPLSIATIKLEAFKDCPALLEIVCPRATTPTIDATAFDDTGLAVGRKVYVPNATSGFAAAAWGDVATIVYAIGYAPAGHSTLPFTTLGGGTQAVIEFSGVATAGIVDAARQDPTGTFPPIFRFPANLAAERLQITGTAAGFTAELTWTLGATLPPGTNKVYCWNGTTLTEYDVTPIGNTLGISGITNAFGDWYAGTAVAVPIALSSIELE